MPPASYVNAFLVTFLLHIVTQPKLATCLVRADLHLAVSLRDRTILLKIH